jgi:general secretion pathway protein D
VNDLVSAEIVRPTVRHRRSSNGGVDDNSLKWLWQSNMYKNFSNFARCSFLVALLTSFLFGLSGCANVNPRDSVNDRSTTSRDSSVIPRRAASAPTLKSGALTDAPSQPNAPKEPEFFQLGSNVLLNGLRAPAAPVAAGAGDTPVSLNFENGDIREIVKNIIGDLLQENFTIHPSVSGTITVRTPKGIRRSELIPTLETLLKSAGFSLVRDASGLWRVLPAAEGVSGILAPRLGSARGEGLSVQVLPVRYIGAKEMQRLMIPFAKGGEAVVRVDELRNILFLTGTEFEIRRLLEIATMFDVDLLAGMSFLLYPLKYSEAKTVLADWDRMFPAATSPFAGLIKVSAIERMNAIFIASPQSAVVQQAKDLIDRLDRRSDGGSEPQLYVYFLKYSQAQKLQPLLQQALSGNRTTTATGPTVAPGQTPSTISAPASPIPGQQNVLPGNTPANPATAARSPQTTTTPTGAPQTPANTAAAIRAGAAALAGGGLTVARNATIVADPDRNALLIVSTYAEFQSIEAVIRQLDIPPKQIAIEVQIAEISLSGAFQFGLKSYFEGKLDGAQNRLTSRNGFGVLAPTGTGSNASVFTYTWRKSDAIQAILDLSETKSQSRILAQPTLLALDNQKATFTSGQQISVRTQTQTASPTTPSTDSFQYVETGITINVTPRVSGENVFLEIQQQLSDPKQGPPGENPPISKSSTSTSVMVQSGDTMLLGGLFQDRGGNSSSGFPVLSSIPVVGGLFGNQQWNSDRTETVLLITPRILNNRDESVEMVDELRQKMEGIELLAPKASTKGLPTRFESKIELKNELNDKK